MQVIATAGHVDHGKSTLVQALTGIDPDRLPEEKRRGLTLDLGFAWRELPSGRTAAFVDVPGHERFVTTMLAGAGPVPAVLFVVAADEGWMPQSAEHLAALDALGVREGLLVVTRSDLGDAALALGRARERLARSSLAAVEALAVSAVTGAGMDGLVSAVDRLCARLPEPPGDAPVRLWADRSFSVPGSGTVVTGTLPAGTIETGDELRLGDRTVSVRTVESLKRRVGAVRGVARVALNLRGVDAADVPRGSALVTPGRWAHTGSIDVRIVPGGDTGAGRLAREMTLHIGSAAVPVRLRPLGPDTARLTLNTPLPLHVGDRALLRDPGRRSVAGVRVLDVRPPALTRRGAGAARARELAAWPDRPGGDLVLRRHGILRPADLEVMGCAQPPEAVRLPEGWVADPAYWTGLRERLDRELAGHAARHPLAPGLPLETARLRLGLPSRRLVADLVRPPLRIAGGRVYAGDGLPAPVADAVGRLRDELAAAPFHAPESGRLGELGLIGPVLAEAVRLGAVLKLADGVVLLPGADRAALLVLSGLPQPFTPGAARAALETSRRVVIPLLELLDRDGHTVRTAGGGRRVTRTG